MKSGVDEVCINGQLPPNSQSLSVQYLMTVGTAMVVIAIVVSITKDKLLRCCVPSHALDGANVCMSMGYCNLSRPASDEVERCHWYSSLDQKTFD